VVIEGGQGGTGGVLPSDLHQRPGGSEEFEDGGGVMGKEGIFTCADYEVSEMGGGL